VSDHAVTADDWAAFVLRMVLAAIFVAQGAVKTFGRFEAPHGRAALTRMIEAESFSHARQLAGLLAVTELGCGALVALGLATRIATLPLLLTLGLAIVKFKWRSGFIAGWDWPFSVFGLAAAVLLLGAGRFSLDAALGFG
jgi:putative oxidoreductase